MTVLDAESAVYPKHLLERCESGLLLFCSGRMGAADGHWFREAGLTAVICVDWDAKTLVPFACSYPSEWRYVEADAFEWARLQTRRWDIVSADVPSQWADRLQETLPLWCSLAERFVTVTLMGDCDMPAAPGGWQTIGVVRRTTWNGRDYLWLVLEREE